MIVEDDDTDHHSQTKHHRLLRCELDPVFPATVKTHNVSHLLKSMDTGLLHEGFVSSTNMRTTSCIDKNKLIFIRLTTMIKILQLLSMKQK